MNRLKVSFSIFFIVLSIMLSGCSESPKIQDNNNSNKLTIAVSIPPEKTFVEAVCGDLVEIITLIPPGNNPENYEPTPIEKKDFENSSIYFTLGVPTESINILPYIKETTKIVSLSNEVSEIYKDLQLNDGRDPHIWLSPKRVIVMIEVITREMVELDPIHQDIYTKNASNFISELENLDKEIKSIFCNIKNNKFIVFHPAFAYFADDYELEMYALEESGKEATVEHLQSMIDLAKIEKINIIYYQAEVDSNQAKAFAEEINGSTIMLSPLAEDYIENMKMMALEIFKGIK